MLLMTLRKKKKKECTKWIVSIFLSENNLKIKQGFPQWLKISVNNHVHFSDFSVAAGMQVDVCMCLNTYRVVCWLPQFCEIMLVFIYT